MTKAQVIAKAKRDVEQNGKPLMVLNLNPYGALYVIRDFDERLLFSDNLVEVIEAFDD